MLIALKNIGSRMAALVLATPLFVQAWAVEEWMKACRPNAVMIYADDLGYAGMNVMALKVLKRLI